MKIFNSICHAGRADAKNLETLWTAMAVIGT